ncbi:TPA: pyrroline-5-carboxylate reductase, partial [Candidatus Micrarchaeota archaeon]|nr:pyrroline-5-carboxylate reductase [Candidatus Micrarchaeota archaeon]
MLQGKKIAVIGVGMVGKAIISGLLRSHAVSPGEIAGSTAHEETAWKAAEELGVEVITDNRKLIRGRDVVIVAVKPKSVLKVLSEIKELIEPEQLLISVAAAVRTRTIEEELGKPVPVVRAMPNMPCLVRQGMTVLCAGRFADRGHLELSREVFSAVGRVA